MSRFRPDGTLYAAVKTSYDTEGMPLVACLIRRPNGVWDPLHHVDDEGSRGIILFDSRRSVIHVVYSSYREQSIVVKLTPVGSIQFGGRRTLMAGSGINNVTSTRQTVAGSFLLAATQGETLSEASSSQVRRFAVISETGQGSDERASRPDDYSRLAMTRSASSAASTIASNSVLGAELSV